MAQGQPHQIITVALLAEIFGIEVTVLNDPITQTPLMVPLGRSRRVAAEIPA